MALFWTFAEGLILFTLRLVFFSLKKGGDKSQASFFIFCVIIFALLICLMFCGEIFFGKFLDLHQGYNLTVYRWALWNFFCTLWVILEGTIMVYVLRIYKTLKHPLKKKDLKEGKSNMIRIKFSYGIPLLAFPLFALYAFYEYNVLSVISKYGLDVKTLYRMSVFYIRVCGIFWILFEWIIAFIGIKTYFILKMIGEPTK